MSKFDREYEKGKLLFGNSPTPLLKEFLDQSQVQGHALDLGCGDGRDTLPLLKRGFSVTAIDRSHAAIETLLTRTDISEDMRQRLTAVHADVRFWHWTQEKFDLVIAVTLLDHLLPTEIEQIALNMIRSTKLEGTIFIEVHTVDDPAVTGDAPVSEFASEIQHYFEWNELLKLFVSSTRILKYEERKEWDYDHGEPHVHGFATLIASRIG